MAYRKVADDTILGLSQESMVMERFGPLPGEPVAECERKARESDVTVCIVAHRYGFVPEKGLGSITRREVEAAKTAGKDVLVWIVADDYGWTEKKEQDLLTDPTVLADSTRIAEIAAGVQALLEFKIWLRANFVCGTFTTPDDLLAVSDTQAALGEAETGLLRIELLVALARIRLAWPDAPKAIQATREALDLAAHPDCGYAWGEADAAQVWGEAYFR